MAAYTFTIPDWRPASSNERERNRWTRKRLMDRDKDMVAGYALSASVPWAQLKRRVSATFFYAKGQRRHDVNNLLKNFFDALVAAKLLVNDSPVWLEHGLLICDRGDRAGTAITLEDLP